MSKTASGLPVSVLRPDSAIVRPVEQAWEAHAKRGAELEDVGEEQKWAAAEEYQKAWEADASQQDIANKVGKSQRHISTMLRTLVLRAEAEVKLPFADAYALAKKPQRPAREDLAVPDSPEGEYRAIVADPPWQYDNKGTRGAVGDVAAGKKFHYSTMTIEEICALEIPAAGDSHLYLWTTNAFIRPAFDVMDAWGFVYKTCLTWVKPQIGMGNYFRNNTEHVLFGVRGKLGTNVNDVGTWFEARRGEHSAKPELFYDLVESASPGPYFEMFARDRGQLWKRDGWQTWGNEA